MTESNYHSQLKYDLAEFLINNKEEVQKFLKERTEHLSYVERVFDNAPEVYDELLYNHRRSALLHYLYDHFPGSFEEIHLILDKEFINITLN